jgi:hypothetical protein
LASLVGGAKSKIILKSQITFDSFVPSKLAVLLPQFDPGLSALRVILGYAVKAFDILWTNPLHWTL